MLLDTAMRSRLDRLALRGKRRLRGVWAGSHRSVRLGESLDFADYREYHPGDDFRRIDYNLWARLGVVLVRLFEAEDEMPLQVVVDSSASMGFGDKFPTAQRLAAMVAYLGLASGERVRLVTVPAADRPSLQGPWARHVSAWPRVERWLEALEPAGGTDLPAAARLLAAPGGHRGPVVLVSDLLAPGWDNAVDVLGTICGGVVLHVLGPDELEPGLSGDLTLRDAETHRELRVSMGQAVMERYRTRATGFVAEAGRRARRAGMDHVLVTARPGAVEEALRAMVGKGWVR
ncbi:MAG: DUF58 domain-containing protein [Acidimicrobiia bacterium]|nr:DUF58 domain-containing protein [Acidimicrobiia bacterium]